LKANCDEIILRLVSFSANDSAGEMVPLETWPAEWAESLIGGHH
jgi:hypothetical protein